MPKSKKDITILSGKFEDAHVHVGNYITSSENPEDFKKPYHDVKFKGETYRFVNPDMISEASLETIQKDNKSFSFAGDLRGMLISVTSGGIRAQHIPELMPEV